MVKGFEAVNVVWFVTTTKPKLLPAAPAYTKL